MMRRRPLAFVPVPGIRSDIFSLEALNRRLHLYDDISSQKPLSALASPFELRPPGEQKYSRVDSAAKSIPEATRVSTPSSKHHPEPAFLRHSKSEAKPAERANEASAKTSNSPAFSTASKSDPSYLPLTPPSPELGPGDSISVMAFPAAAAPNLAQQQVYSEFLHPSRAEGEQGRLRSELASEATKRAHAEVLKQRQAKTAKELSEELYSSLHKPSKASSQKRDTSPVRQSRRSSGVGSKSTRKTGAPTAKQDARPRKSTEPSRYTTVPSTLAAYDLQSQVFATTTESEGDHHARPRSRAPS